MRKPIAISPVSILARGRRRARLASRLVPRLVGRLVPCCHLACLLASSGVLILIFSSGFLGYRLVRRLVYPVSYAVSLPGPSLLAYSSRLSYVVLVRPCGIRYRVERPASMTPQPDGNRGDETMRG